MVLVRGKFSFMKLKLNKYEILRTLVAPWMQVITMVNSHKGMLQYRGVGRSWRRWNPTWRGMDFTCLKHVRTVQWTDQESVVESRREPFVDPSGRGHSMVIGGRSKGWRSITLGRPLQVSFMCRVANSSLKDMGKWKMEGYVPLSREGSKEGCNCS